MQHPFRIMAHRNRRHCPICGKQDLLKLSNHLSQAHQLTSEERQPLLKRALLSRQVIPLVVQDASYPTELPRNTCPVVAMPSNRPLCLEPQPYPEFQFQHMFSMMVVGPSQCGKTHFVQQLLTQNCIDFPEKKPWMVYWFYSQWQPSYEAIQRALQKKIRFAQGLPELKDDLSNITLARNNILVLDDLMSQATDSPVVSKLFTQGRHRNASVILLLQNMFPKGKYNTDISRNATYKVLFRSPGDRKQIDIMAEQTFAKDRPHFMKAYSQETELPYGYIIVDNHPRTTGKRQVVANVFGDCQSYPCTPVPLTDARGEEAKSVDTKRSKAAVNNQPTVTHQGSKRVQPIVTKQNTNKRSQSSVKKRKRVQSTGKKRKRVQSAVKIANKRQRVQSSVKTRQLPKTREQPSRRPRTSYLPLETDSEEDFEEDHSDENDFEEEPLEEEDSTEEDLSGGAWQYPKNRLIARPRPRGGFGPKCSYD